MPTLAQIQQQLLHALHNPDSHPSGWIAAAELSPKQGLSVYRESVIAIHSQALALIYPVCQALLGKRYFDQAAKRYWQQSPSQTPSLSHWGAGWPTFIHAEASLAAMAYLPDLTRLEWALHQADEGPDSHLVDMTQLATDLAHPGLTWQLNPNASLLQSPYAIDHLWQAHQHDTSTLEQLDISRETPCHLLIYRPPQQRAQFTALSPAQWTLLQQTQAGLSFTQSLSEVLIDYPDFDPQSTLLQAIQMGWFSGYTLAA